MSAEIDARVRKDTPSRLDYTNSLVTNHITIFTLENQLRCLCAKSACKHSIIRIRTSTSLCMSRNSDTFQSAVDIATQCIDQIHTTAASHGRVFIVEVMGHKVGYLTLNAGIAGGADIILIEQSFCHATHRCVQRLTITATC